jgi:hypothetical protein
VLVEDLGVQERRFQLGQVLVRNPGHLPPDLLQLRQILRQASPERGAADGNVRERRVIPQRLAADASRKNALLGIERRNDPNPTP